MLNTEIFPWNKNFETGIEIIDQQHQKLVHLINSLARHIAYQADPLTLDKVFEELKDYANYHFNTEEQIWSEYLDDDDRLKNHQELHSTFLEQISDIKQHNDYEEQNKGLEEILSFLTHWLAFHILDSDMRMAKLIQAIQTGATLEQAKRYSDEQMNGAMHVLIATILKMYDCLSARTLSLMKEIVEREKAQARLRLTGKVIECSLESIFITDQNKLLIDANPAFSTMCQLSHEQLLGKHINELKPALDKSPLKEAIAKGLTEIGHWVGEVWSETEKGDKEPEWMTISAIKSDDGVITNYAGVFSSMSQLVERQQALEHAANHDLLTGLPNRRLLVDRLQQALLLAKRSQKTLAVCFLDLDGFKTVNDTLSHAAGDALLIVIAQRLQNEIRAVDTVARLGGDEFVLVLNGLSDGEDISSLLNNLLSVIAQPVIVDGEYAQVTASIGVAIGRNDSDTPDILIAKADQAMYQAKQAGKSCYKFDENDS